LSPPEGYRHDKIRIGYMSSDFCNHAISFLIAELFEQHDRSAFEVFGYCFSPEDGSEVRARIVGAMDHYVSIKTLSDEQAAQRIRDDEIDILVDLNGLTAGARLPILRWKPAPVQATYLGYVGPVPLPELDYMFCDDVVVPPDIAPLYEPKPLSIAGNYQANDSKRKIGRPMTRAENNLPDGKFVFCCFSNHYKITEDMFTAWMTILKQTGDSVLWMASDTVWSTEAMRARAAASGVDPNRLLLAERVDPAMYMSRLRVADLFLDTFPYNAGTIASDAIRMQLPLVTLAGQSFASRMAARFLTALGATAGIANTLDDYAAIAIRLANDPASYAAYKAFYSESAWQETIGNVGLFTREYEATLHRVRLGGSA
jgi:predicted O-linked N-acetylglucosamine transferase (SPINDLY family)